MRAKSTLRLLAVFGAVCCLGVPARAQFEQLKKLGRAALQQTEDPKQIAYFKIDGGDAGQLPAAL